MAKESFQLFLSIHLLKTLNILWKFYINITDSVGITVWSEAIFIISLKKYIVFKVFVKLLKHRMLVPYNLHHLLKFSVKVQIHLFLFQCKYLKFTFRVVCYMNNTWILLWKVDKLSFFMISRQSLWCLILKITLFLLEI